MVVEAGRIRTARNDEWRIAQGSQALLGIVSKMLAHDDHESLSDNRDGLNVLSPDWQTHEPNIDPSFAHCLNLIGR